ncbi:MAG: TetR/AcrR family transcriptional regulator [Solirubrobacteraceae bacterium]
MTRRRLTMQESKARTRKRLIASARKAFLRRGFYGSSMETIAEEAGYTVGALYSQFDGKGELFVAVFEEYVAGRAAEIQAAADAALPVEQQTAEAAAQWVEKLITEPAWFPLFIEFWSHSLRNPELQAKFAVPLGAVRVAVERIVERYAEERGIELPLPAGQIATAIKALGNGIALEKTADPDAVPDALFGEFLAIFLLGLEARAHAASHPIPERAG